VQFHGRFDAIRNATRRDFRWQNLHFDGYMDGYMDGYINTSIHEWMAIQSLCNTLSYILQEYEY
jgi:hypothetical protein